MGISYLASPTRNLVINGVVTIAATRGLDENSKSVVINKPYELLLFNDVLVYMKQSMASRYVLIFFGVFFVARAFSEFSIF
jgi:hypothetical protein